MHRRASPASGGRGPRSVFPTCCWRRAHSCSSPSTGRMIAYHIRPGIRPSTARSWRRMTGSTISMILSLIDGAHARRSRRAPRAPAPAPAGRRAGRFAGRGAVLKIEVAALSHVGEQPVEIFLERANGLRSAGHAHIFFHKPSGSPTELAKTEHELIDEMGDRRRDSRCGVAGASEMGWSLSAAYPGRRWPGFASVRHPGREHRRSHDALAISSARRSGSNS